MAETPANRFPYVHVDVQAAEVEFLSFRLWELGAQGVEERDQTTIEHGPSEGVVTLVASFETVDAAELVIEALRPEREARLVFVEGEEWRHSWKRFFRPKRHGSHFLVTPPWESPSTEPGDKVIVVEPGNAFGTGMHETTSLVLAELEGIVESGHRVLDVGCGSGILGIGAVLLGASHVVAVDIDPDAVVATRENAERNQMLTQFEVSTDPIESVEGAYEVVLANIQAHILRGMAAPLSARVAPGGSLVLSGILVEATDEVIESFSHMQLEAVESLGDWVAIRLRARLV
jgi:ribosomal protein L11 methyltransferase